MDPGMNHLLKWGIENSDASGGEPLAESASANRLNAEALAALLGGPSDAELMNASMKAITSADVTLDNKLTAFDNLEQLVETIDNANNLEILGLWTPLVQQLQNEESELRRMAAWCIGTAVQNNPKAQERLLVLEAIPTLLNLALSDPAPNVRQKAVYALSSGVRNYQPSLNVLLRLLPEQLIGRSAAAVDAGDMGAIDQIMTNLRERSKGLCLG
ncbi:MAG: hsp70 nucleotide exchange factor fes1 [Geoglossum umbratile]|nr:MAG: hsp70 nucleotide exchange factor fes1 [Geoglossum umbratile]